MDIPISFACFAIVKAFFFSPSANPSANPSAFPSANPSAFPSANPSTFPSAFPSIQPDWITLR